MLLQIVVTQYEDGQECIKRLLDSIQLQQDIDFNDIEIIIINDGNKLILDKALFNNYSFRINYYIEEWSGLSGARQHGLDKVTAPYVMFSDGDDLFYRNNALWDILKKLREENPDVLVSRFTTDMWDETTNTFSYFKEYYDDNVFIHGKVFKKEFLDKYDIKWNIKLKGLYEDSYFVRLCFANNPKKSFINETVWFWKYRKGSITRTDTFNWSIKTYVNKMESNSELVRQMLKRGKEKEAMNYAFVQAHECYFYVLQDFWTTNEEYLKERIKIEKRFVEYWNEFHELIENISTECARIIIDVLRKRFYEDLKRVSLEPITFNDWKNLVLRKWSN